MASIRASSVADSKTGSGGAVVVVIGNPSIHGQHQCETHVGEVLGPREDEEIQPELLRVDCPKMWGIVPERQDGIYCANELMGLDGVITSRGHLIGCGSGLGVGPISRQ